MKFFCILWAVFLMSCGASGPSTEAPTQVAKQQVSDEEIISSLLATDISTDPLSTRTVSPTSDTDTDTGPEGMIFED